MPMIHDSEASLFETQWKFVEPIFPLHSQVVELWNKRINKKSESPTYGHLGLRTSRSP